MPTMDELRILQDLPLEVKVKKTEARIREWVNHFGLDGVYISFSGGKDSTVLLDICRKMYPDMKAVYVDTGLEYPEIKEFVKSFNNVDIIRPKLTFKQIVEKYGYPFISKPVSNTVAMAKKNVAQGNYETTRVKKLQGIMDDGKGGKSQFNYEKYLFLLEAPFLISDKCCDYSKKKPSEEYESQTGRKPILGQLTAESIKRRNGWLKTGCNAFESKRQQSNPMAFWKEQDVLHYIYENKLPIASVYGDVVVVDEDEDGMKYENVFGFAEYDQDKKLTTTGCTRTGCMWCGFGCHLNNDDRFTSMKTTHPAIYDYVFRAESEGGLGYKEKIDWLNEHGNLNIRY